jgi:hypothetical protein
MIQSHRLCSGIVLAGAVTLALSPPAYCQTTTPQHTNVNVNYVYSASLGFGGYSLAGLSAGVYTLPLFDTLPNTPSPGWSLKLMLPIQLGIYHFNGSFEGQSISISQQSLTAVPGAELQIPITDNFVIKPFAQGGIGHTFGSDVGNPDAWVYLAGARSVAQWRAGEYTLSLGNAVIYAGDNSVGPGFGEHYVSLQIGGEVLRPMGFKFAGLAPDLGVYAAGYYYPTPLQFSRFLEEPLRISYQTEIGFSVGSAEPFKLLWLSNPRIGAGIVFGGGLTVYHVNFGFPF